MNKQRIVLAVASGFGMLATFLPWITKSFFGIKIQSISGTNMEGGIGWISFVFFALTLIIAFLGNRAKPLVKIKYLAASIGWTNVMFGYIVALYAETIEYTHVSLGLALVIIAGLSVYFVSLYAKCFGNKESVVTKFGFVMSLISLIIPLLLILLIFYIIYIL